MERLPWAPPAPGWQRMTCWPSMRTTSGWPPTRFMIRVAPCLQPKGPGDSPGPNELRQKVDHNSL